MCVCVGGGGWSISARSWSVKEDCIVLGGGGGGGAVKQDLLVSLLCSRSYQQNNKKQFRVTFGN